MNTPTYRVEFRRVTAAGRLVSHTPPCWNSKHSGRANAANLALYIEGLEASTREGGVNAHLGETKVGYARLVRQATGETVAEYGSLA